MSHTIGVDNSGIIASLLVKDHPEWMWYREAIQNALESTKTYISQKNIESADIKVRKLHLKGLIADEYGNEVYKNKLCVLNLGGMTGTELVKAIKLGGSGKTASLNANYGVGIKTSVLNWSDLLIITFKDGKGHFAWLGKEYTNGIDFNIVAYSDDGQGRPVLECTEWIKSNAEERDYNLNHDFTEVVILGQAVNQDTYLNTFGFGPDGNAKKVNAGHIKENLSKRYFRLPDNIKIKIDHSANTFNNDTVNTPTITFKTFTEAFSQAEVNSKIVGEKPRMETVQTNDGILIHYYWDGPCGPSYLGNPTAPATETFLNGPGWTTAFSGFVWRDEVYNPQVNTHRQWKTVAFRLGIQDKFNHFRIFVEMPDRAVTTDKYRVTLHSGSGELAFDSDENLYMIMAHMPEWYKEKTKETKKDLKTDLDEALRDMFARYMDLDRPLIGKPSKHQGPIIKRTQGQGNNQSAKPKGGKGPVQKNFKNPQFTQPDVPAMREATDDEIKDWQIKDNFGALVVKGNDDGRDLLIYNPHYKSIEKIASLSVSKLPDPEQYFEIAKVKAKTELTLNSALWIMICRSRIAQEKMTLDEFGVSTSSDFLDTYIFARELQISEDVARFVNQQFKQDDKIISQNISDLENRLVSVGGKVPEVA